MSQNIFKCAIEKKPLLKIYLTLLCLTIYVKKKNYLNLRMFVTASISL